MTPLSDSAAGSNSVLYVFYDFETTQNTPYSEKATLHVPNLVCVQQFCSQCEDIADIEQDCERCEKRKHYFWDDSVGDLLNYLCKPRPWANSHCHSSQRQGIRSAVYSKQGDFTEMATGTDYEWDVDSLYVNGTSSISGISVIHSVTAAQIVRSIWSSIVQIVISALF
jgi:hypothetical protein